MSETSPADDEVDAGADIEIDACLDLDDGPDVSQCCRAEYHGLLLVW